MYSKTDAQLITLVRFYTDTAGAATRFPDADIKLMLDVGMACYWSQLAKSMCLVDIQAQSVAITTATEYAVTAHSKLIAVEKLVGDKYIPIRRANLFTVESDKQSGQWFYSEHMDATEGVATQSIVLHRRSNDAGGYFRMRYIAAAPNVTAGDMNTGWGFINGWEEVPVLEAAIRLLAKDKEDDTHLRKLLDRAYERMANEASESDVFQRPTSPGTIRDEQWAGMKDYQI